MQELSIESCYTNPKGVCSYMLRPKQNDVFITNKFRPNFKIRVKSKMFYTSNTNHKLQPNFKIQVKSKMIQSSKSTTKSISFHPK